MHELTVMCISLLYPTVNWGPNYIVEGKFEFLTDFDCIFLLTVQIPD